MIAAVVASVLAMGLLAGPPGPATGPPTGLPTKTWVDEGVRPDRDRLTASGQPGTCHDKGVNCGHLRVPLDRRDDSAGTVRLHYEMYPRRDRSRPLLGTIVAVEGGPGYSTTGSRAYYRDLFEPLLDRRRLLLVDNRGTGRSEPIDCPQLQAYRGDYITAVGRCGRQLGSTSDLYGTALAVRDLVDVLDRLGIGRVDLYGDSYGTFFSQAFAVRFPERLRTLILDAAYFVGGTDPWYSDTNRALRYAFDAACRRSPPCAGREGSTMGRVGRLADLLRRSPLRGRAPNADGVVRRVTVDTGKLIDLLTAAASSPTLYRELDAAVRAVLRSRRYALPLLRLAREITYTGGAGAVRGYSEGLYVAVACNDYPQPYDMTDPLDARPEQYARSVRRLQRLTPRLFAPFGVREWVSSPYGYYADCIRWPVPSRWVHPIPADATYPDVPTLVLAGDLDSLTSPEGARATVRAFPDSTFVGVANTTHVSALVDFDQCASVLVRRFVRTRQAGDTSCARDYHENRLVDRFAPTARGLGWSGPRRQTARVAASTVADVIARWLSMSGYQGVGLQGGSFSTRGGAFTADRPVVRWRLDGVRWVRDVAVSGAARWNRRSGAVRAVVTVRGPGTEPGQLTLRWDDQDRRARAVASGRVGGVAVSEWFRAP